MHREKKKNVFIPKHILTYLLYILIYYINYIYYIILHILYILILYILIHILIKRSYSRVRLDNLLRNIIIISGIFYYPGLNLHNRNLSSYI